MPRSLLANASMLVLVLLLAGLTWLSLEQQEKEAKTALTSLSPDQVSLIRIESGKGSLIRLERMNSGWMMTQPSKARADDTKINRLLEITLAISIRKFKPQQEMTQYGLNPPQAVLTLNKTRIEMGSLHPINQRRYMRVGNMIHLINDRFSHLLQASAKSYMATKAQ